MSSGRLRKVETTKNYRTGLKSAHGCLRGGGRLREIRIIEFCRKNSLVSVLDRWSHMGDGRSQGGSHIEIRLSALVWACLGVYIT